MTTITVTNLNDNGSGSLRQAILDANSGDTINFAAGLAGGTLTLMSGELDITKNLTIDGFINGDGTPLITIDANGASRVFDVPNGTKANPISATLNALTIEGGYVKDANGGGIAVGTYDSVTVGDSRVTGNRAVYTAGPNGGDGGAIYVDFGGTLTLLKTSVDHNTAQSVGGGIFGTFANLNVVNSTLSGNTARDGGGVNVINGTLTLVNATLAGNSATGAGGGIFDTSSTVKLYDSTLTGNLSPGTGGILDSFGNGLTLSNSIVAGNQGPKYADIYSDFGTKIYFAGNNILGSSPNVQNGTSIDKSNGTYTQIDGTSQAALATVFAHVGNNPDTGVLSGVLANNGGPVETAAINPAGIAYNAAANGALPTDTFDLNNNGNTTEPLPVDARGFTRVVGGTVDIGAFEQQQGTTFVVTTTADNPYDGGTLAQELAEGNGLSLRQAIGLANQDPASADTITFSPDLIDHGQFNQPSPPILHLTNGPLTVNGNVTIDGDVNGVPGVDVEGSGTTQDFVITGGMVTLNGLSIDNGDGVAGGGVSLSTGSYGPADVTISRSTLSGNRANNGGGIAVAAGDSLTLINSTVSGNTANYDGGGIDNQGSLKIVDSSVRNNNATYAGGGIANQGTLTVLNSTLDGNTLEGGFSKFGRGGAGLENLGTAALANTTISNNTGAYSGGGIYNGGGLTLTNLTIADNSARNGGGLYNGVGDATIYDSTFTGNYAKHDGGGIEHISGSLMTLTNSLIAGNGAGLGSPVIAAVPGTINYAGVNLFSQAGYGRPGIDIVQPDLTRVFASLTTIDPDGVPNSGDEFQAGALGLNGGTVQTVAIKPRGSAQDTGSTAALPPDTFDLNNNGNTSEPLPVDARGDPRVFGPAVDIGAFEAQGPVPFDLNGDGISDLVFQNNGQPGVWLWNGTAPIAEVGFANPSPAWRIITSRDVNGDGNADLIWQNSDGTPGIWLMNGTTPIAEAGLSNPGANWHIVASGDTNGDGKADLIWQENGGTLGVWLMNGTTPIAQAGLGNPGSNWKVVGAADFNGDGKDDILLQDASTGNLMIDLMNGTSISSTKTITVGDPSWHAVSTGEFNGQAAIAWQNTNGTAGIWLMNGTAPATKAGLGNPGAGWQLVSVDHFTPDGQPDLLFQNTNSAMTIWETNGGVAAGVINPPNPGGWQSVNGHPFATG